jgi:hypothetical protein
MPSEFRSNYVDRLTSVDTLPGGQNQLPFGLALLLISLTMIAAVWWWLATPVTLAYAPDDPPAKLDCVSYAPFRDDQTPRTRGLIVSPEQIAEDLVELAKISQCVRCAYRKPYPR